MAKHYFRGWFWIDFTSCLPLGYLKYVLNSDDGGGGADNTKALKVLRLIR